MPLGKTGKQTKNPALYWNANRPDAFAIAVAAILTLLIHAAIIFSVPYNPEKIKEKPKDDLQIIIEEPKFDRRIPETVEANPLANNAEPSKNAPESYMNQRAADEITDANSKSKMPYVEGEIKDGKKIVQGTAARENAFVAAQQVMETLQRPLQQPANPKEAAKPEPAPQTQPQEQPLEPKPKTPEDSAEKDVPQQRGAEKSLNNDNRKNNAEDKVETRKKNIGQQEQKNSANVVDAASGRTEDSPDSVFKSLQKQSEKSSAKDAETKKQSGADEKIRHKRAENALKKDSLKNLSAKKSTPNTDKKQETPKEQTQPQATPQPKSRPTLSMKTPMGPLADNRVRASQQGTLAVDSRFSEFGAYQQRMIEAISRQWNLLGNQYDLSTAVGTQVVIEFRLNTRGELTHIQVLLSNSTNLGRGLCEQSILTTAPYGEWTEEMVSALGTQDCPVRITYYYR